MDDSTLGTQGQVVPDMIEMLLIGFVIQESIVDYLNLLFDAFNNFIIMMGIGVSSSKVALRHSQAHVLHPLCNEGCERLACTVLWNRVHAIYSVNPLCVTDFSTHHLKPQRNFRKITNVFISAVFRHNFSCDPFGLQKNDL